MKTFNYTPSSPLTGRLTNLGIALGMILSVSRQNDEQSHDTPRSETLYER